MTGQEFESVKPVNYSSYEKEIRDAFDSLKDKMRKDGVSKDLIDEVNEVYLVSVSSIGHIRNDHNKINRISWHLANLG